MNTEVILVRYGELALKGKNRSDFEDRLVRNIRQKLASIPDVKVVKSFGRIFVETDRSHSASVLRGLGDVFGVVGFSPAKRVQSDLEAIKEAAVRLVEYRNPFPRTFKVAAKRADKSFPLSSGDQPPGGRPSSAERKGSPRGCSPSGPDGSRRSPGRAHLCVRGRLARAGRTSRGIQRQGDASAFGGDRQSRRRIPVPETGSGAFGGPLSQLSLHQRALPAKSD